MNTHNPILEEIYAIREKLLADCDDDMHRYVEEARQRALASGRPIVDPLKRTKPCNEDGHDRVSLKP